MAGQSSHDVLGRARRHAARLAAERAELLARRDAIDLRLGLVDEKAATVQVVIDYCESEPDDDPEPDDPADTAGPSASRQAGTESSAWGRQPDRNVQGLTRVELARRMLDMGSPLAPRMIAEAFHGSEQVSRGQIESVRRVLRKMVTTGDACVLPNGMYVAVGGGHDQAPAASGEAPEAPASEAAATAPATETGARTSTWTPRVIPGMAAGPAAADVQAVDGAGVGRAPYAVSANALLQLLATCGRPMRAREMAQALGRKPTRSQLESIRQIMRRCVERGQAVLVERGLWAIAVPASTEGRASS